MMKTYNKILLLSTGLVLFLCAATALWVQPINNDLTRTGAYPERWFGWNTPQKRPTKLNASAPQEGKKSILVIGDSFSESGYWQPYLSDKYTFSFAHIRHINFDGMLKKIADEKPDAVVIESIERDLIDIFGSGEKMGSGSSTCNYSTAVSVNRAAISSVQLADALQKLPTFPDKTRPRWPNSLTSLSEGFYYLKSWQMGLLDPKHRNAQVFKLTNAHLFSSARSDYLLVLSSDALLKKSFAESEINSTRCGMQKVAEALFSLKVPYLILAVPDKTTAYQPYLENAALRNKPAFIDEIHVDYLVHGINMLPLLRSRLEAGQQDLYLPSDTHWGYAGYQVAAVLVDHELTTQWYHP